eukprot:2263342-Rhodomonas_salina.1
MGEQALREFDAAHGRGDAPLPTAAVGLATGAVAVGGATGASAGGVAAGVSNMYSSLPGRMTNVQMAHELMLDR